MKKQRLNFNITREEYSALDTLREDKDIVVFPADSRQFSQEVRELSLEPGEVMTSYDVKFLFMCILQQGGLEAVRRGKWEGGSLGERMQLSRSEHMRPTFAGVVKVNPQQSKFSRVSRRQ